MTNPPSKFFGGLFFSALKNLTNFIILVQNFAISFKMTPLFIIIIISFLMSPPYLCEKFWKIFLSSKVFNSCGLMNNWGKWEELREIGNICRHFIYSLLFLSVLKESEEIHRCVQKFTEICRKLQKSAAIICKFPRIFGDICRNSRKSGNEYD